MYVNLHGGPMPVIDPANFNFAINNAFQQVKRLPEHQSIWWDFSEWMLTNYKMYIGCSDCCYCRGSEFLIRDRRCIDYTDDQRTWEIIAYDDDSLAVMFKLKYA